MDFIRKNNAVIVPELAQFIPFKAGATWRMLWKIFYYTRLLKYVHWEQYKKIDKSFTKICSKKTLDKFCDLDLLHTTGNLVYTATDKTLPILKEAGFLTETLPPQARGKGDINEINNTEVFISLMKEEHFNTFLYPNFSYLIPDTLLVQHDKENRKFKLTFIEVERQKPEWEQWIEDKKQNYLKLSTDYKFLEYWKTVHGYLEIPFSEDVKFNYQIIKWMD